MNCMPLHISTGVGQQGLQPIVTVVYDAVACRGLPMSRCYTRPAASTRDEPLTIKSSDGAWTIGILRGRAPVVHTPTSLEPVQFVLVAPDAHSVAVVGDFNDWGLNDTALVATNHEGIWSVTAPVPAGVHRYAFVVNGKVWVQDPSAPRSVGDDFGMPSSALVVQDGAK